MLPFTAIAPDIGGEEPPARPEGLRDRKREKTRLAIEDVALELFSKQGYEATTVEEIADRADISPGTFFRYFPTKGDVLFTERGDLLPALQQAIVDRPADEDDFEALRQALQQEWVAKIDPGRVLRQAQAIDTSHVLTGLSYQIGVRWREAISDALAQRSGLKAPDRRCRLIAGTALSVFGNALLSWRLEGANRDLGRVVDETYELMTEVTSEWLGRRPRPGRRR